MFFKPPNNVLHKTTVISLFILFYFFIYFYLLTFNLFVFIAFANIFAAAGDDSHTRVKNQQMSLRLFCCCQTREQSKTKTIKQITSHMLAVKIKAKQTATTTTTVTL